MQEIKIHYPGTKLLLLCNAKVILGYLTLLHIATLFLLHISLCVYIRDDSEEKLYNMYEY